MTELSHDPREATFLAGQETRTQERQQRQQQKQQQQNEITQSSSSSRATDWIKLKIAMQKLQQQMEDIRTKTHVTATQRREGRESLNSIAREIRALNSNVDIDWPEADQRLAQQDLVKLTSYLEEVLRGVCPPEKFVFSRYRKSLSDRACRREHGSVKTKDQSSTQPKTETSPTEASLRHKQRQGAVVENMSDFKIVVDASGAVSKQAKGAPIPIQPKRQQEQTTELSSSSLVIQNLTQCHVIVSGHFKVVHILHASNCTVEIEQPVDGAIHVTSCISTEIWAASQQIRLHDSSKLTLHLFVRAGPIMENCNNLTFHGDYYDYYHHDDDFPKDNEFHQVKDFGWLRQDVPSPNYCVVLAETPMSSPMIASTRDIIEVTPESPDIASEEAVHPDNPSEEAESSSSSEDEL